MCTSNARSCPVIWRVSESVTLSRCWRRAIILDDLEDAMVSVVRVVEVENKISGDDQCDVDHNEMNYVMTRDSADMY